MWGEYVSGGSLDSRVWPRTAAAAERLWSNSNGSLPDVEIRLQSQRERLEYRNIQAEVITPEWCNLHDLQCS